MIPTHDVNASIELEESFISECSFSNRLITLGTDALLTNARPRACNRKRKPSCGKQRKGSL